MTPGVPCNVKCAIVVPKVQDPANGVISKLRLSPKQGYERHNTLIPLRDAVLAAACSVQCLRLPYTERTIKISGPSAIYRWAITRPLSRQRYLRIATSAIFGTVPQKCHIGPLQLNSKVISNPRTTAVMPLGIFTTLNSLRHA